MIRPFDEAAEPTTHTRAEHIAWCRERAREYCDRGEPFDAFASLISDLGKHPATRDHTAIERGMLRLIAGELRTVDRVRAFIADLQ